MVYDLVFQSTRPIRGATLVFRRFFPWMKHFNPRAPYGARPTTTREIPKTKGFQSTRPIRGATKPPKQAEDQQSISIHAPHTGRDKADNDIRPRISISIHAPHTGRDAQAALLLLGDLEISIHAPHTGRDVHPSPEAPARIDISIHAPHTGRDPEFSARSLDQTAFQSTRPIRGATFARC